MASHNTLNMKAAFLKFLELAMSFSFDPSQTSGNRVVPDSVCVAEKPLVLNNSYKLCTKGYIAAGKDGYDVFRDCKVLVNEE